MDTNVAAVAKQNQFALNQFVLFSLLIIAAYMATTVAAYAAPSAMGDVLCRVLLLIYGNMGRGLAVLAICTIGVGATVGKVSWGLAITVAVGIAVVFGSAEIAYRLLYNTGLPFATSTMWAQNGC